MLNSCVRTKQNWVKKLITQENREKNGNNQLTMYDFFVKKFGNDKKE